MSSLKNQNKPNILFIAPYPTGLAPGQRFRYEFYYELLSEKKLPFQIHNLLTVSDYQILYQDGKGVKKLLAITQGLLKRALLMFKVSKFTHIFIFREAFFFGPPIFEWIIAKVLRKKIIYDFDDAIWMADGTNESTLWKWIKWRSKVASICRWSWKVSVGNEYLASYAQQFCDQVEILPTVVDTDIHQAPPARTKSDLKSQQPTANSHRLKAKEETLRQAQNDLTIENQRPKAKGQKPIIGWTGSHSTLQYLHPIVPVLQELEKTHDFTFLVIANQDPQLPLKDYCFAKWNKESEVEDLAQIDIGVMPLEDNEWSKGKCGFKLIQYLSLGIPAVASPVGVNAEIVIHNKTGLIATTSQQWLEALKQLLELETLRKKMGDSGRKLIEDRYSVKSQQESFLQLFQ